MIKKRVADLSLFLLLSVFMVQGQKVQKNIDYINSYSKLAIEQQKKYKIPASIKLAQGILESQSGSSRLAVKANNHFGIKCSNWTGQTISHDDELSGECFRKYSSVAESYEDHSQFLSSRSRYEVLFTLSQTDYSGWAHGLQKCGYATDRAYPGKLIKIIEDYELYKYDNPGFTIGGSSTKQNKLPDWYVKHDIYKDHGLIYVIGKDGDTYDLIGEELGFRAKKLKKYNEVPDSFQIKRGEIIYLEKKNKKAKRTSSQFHTVKGGDSMHSIAQQYGIRIKNLYKINNKDASYAPVVGDMIKLR